MIIIVYNEEDRIGPKIANCMELEYPEEMIEICVVSDGSTDGTNGILRDAGGIVYIEDTENHGKPYQINRAVEATGNEILLFSDARQMYGPQSLRKLVANFRDPDVGCVSGELVFGSTADHTGGSIGLYWTYEKLLRKAESEFDSTLGATGAIYAVRRGLFAPIPEDTILDDIEIPLQAFRKGYRVVFEPEAVAFDTVTTDIGDEFRRKVRTLAGNFQLFRRNMWLMNPLKNRIFFQTVSHKLFRLLIPYALITVAVTSAISPGTAFKLFFWSQILCYIAGIAALTFEGIRRVRLVNLILVFMTLNAASVTALFHYLGGKSSVRWRREDRP